MSRNNQAPETVEQLAFVDVGPEGISKIDLLCSGFLLEPEPIMSDAANGDAYCLVPVERRS